MKALVTGASGFTGSHLVKALQEKGYTVTGLVRKTSNLKRLSERLRHLKIVYGDITNREALKLAMTDVDIVFHTAAYVELGIVNEAEMQRVNVEGTRAVLEVAKITGISKLIYCSTIGIFGDTGGKVIDETFQRQQLGFSSAYDRTKYEAQKLVDEFAKQGYWAVSVMPSGIFGIDDPHFGPVMQTFLKGRLKVWAGGERPTGIVHVDDLCQGMILAAEKGKSGEYYILSAGELKLREMFEIFSQETGIPAPVEAPELLVRILANILDPLGRLFSWQPPLSRERIHYIYDRCVRVDASKAQRELGWQPRSPEQTLREIVRNLL